METRELSKEKLAELQEEIAPLAQAFDLVDDHVVITDPDARIIYANYAVQENTGYSSSEVIGKNPAELWGGNMPKEFYEKMWTTIKTEKRPFVGEVKNKRKDGTEYWQEVRIYPIFGQYGDIKIFIGMEPNITTRKTAEGEAKRKFEEIDKMNKFMIDRELKMVELKKEIETLKSQLSRK